MDMRGIHFQCEAQMGSEIPVTKLATWALLAFFSLAELHYTVYLFTEIPVFKKTKHMMYRVKNCIQVALCICGVSARGFNQG